MQIDLRGCNKRYFYRESLIFRLIDNVLQEDIDQVDIIPSIKSDHSTILLVIDSVDNQMRGPSFWKFNASLLDDKNMLLTCIKIKLTGLRT